MNTLDSSASYSVLLVEDDPPTRYRLANIIGEHQQLSLLAACENLAEARAVLVKANPDVLLTDLGLPDGHGTTLIREVRQKNDQIEIMVISVFGDERNVLNAIEAGATGYLLKDSDARYVAESILELIAGGSPISPSIARHLLRRFNKPKEVLPENTVLPALTKREMEVLQGVAKGLTYSEIAGLLGMSPNTVTSHIKHIYRKLEVRSRSEAVFEAVQMGLIKLSQ